MPSCIHDPVNMLVYFKEKIECDVYGRKVSRGNISTH